MRLLQKHLVARACKQNTTDTALYCMRLCAFLCSCCSWMHDFLDRCAQLEEAVSAAQAEAAATKKKADERKEKMKSEMLRAKAHIDEQARQHQVRPRDHA